jgi:hypothetical protein
MRDEGIIHGDERCLLGGLHGNYIVEGFEVMALVVNGAVCVRILR